MTRGTVVARSNPRRTRTVDPLSVTPKVDVDEVQQVRRSIGRGARRAAAGVDYLCPTPYAPDATTRQLEGLYPFLAPPAGASATGIVQGVDKLSGGAFTWDAFANYSAGIVSNPSALLIGEVGSRKSTLTKCHLRRALTVGRQAFVIDPKGEYTALAADVGGRVIRLEPGGTSSLCPLVTGHGVHSVNVAMIAAILGLLLDRELAPVERLVIGATVAHLTGFDETTQTSSTPATVADVYHAISHPTDAMLAVCGLDCTTHTATTTDLRYTLARLCDRGIGGDLAGMIDGSSTVAAEATLTVIDVSAVYARRESNSQAFALALLCGIAWVQGEVMRRQTPAYLVVDEAWSVLGNLEAARYLQGALKLARQWGLATWLVMHRLSDLRIGDHGSSHYSLVTALLRDVGTVIVYRQAPAEADLLERWLNLPAGQVEIVTAPTMANGLGLWRFGRHVHLVEHRATRTEIALCDTDQAMRQLPPPRGTAVNLPAPGL